MKPLMIFRCLLPAFVVLTSTAIGDDVSDLVKDAERTYVRGELSAAKEKFDFILRVDPNNRLAKSYRTRILAEVAKERAGRPPTNATQEALTRIIVEKIDFREASLSETLDYLKQKGNQLGGGKVSINFVQQLDEATQNAKITLALNNVPFSEVLKYIGKLANVQFTYDPYAIVVKPATAQPAAAPQAPTGVKINGL